MSKRGNNEGTISKRKDGRWEARISVGGGKRRIFYGKTRREAQHKLVAALRDQQQGLLVAPERLTLGPFLERWLEDSVRRTVRPRTYASYADLVRLRDDGSSQDAQRSNAALPGVDCVAVDRRNERLPERRS